MMEEGGIPTRLEESALKALFLASNDAKWKCLCCSRLNNQSKMLCGWMNSEKVQHLPSTRTKAKKNGHDGIKQYSTKSKINQRQRNSKKGDEIGKGYFRNHKTRKQHIDSYRQEYSTIRQAPEQDDSSTLHNHMYEKVHDPYLIGQLDHRHLYKRLNLLQTLSDFYSIGVSTRDLRRQAYLPPVTMTYNKPRTKSITKSDPLEMEAIVDDISKELNECQIGETSTAASKEFGRVCSSLLGKDIDTSWKEDIEVSNRTCNSGCSASNVQSSPADFLQSFYHESSSKRDLKRPSQKLIDGLGGSLKEQLTVLRSGSDSHRHNYQFHLNSDRFVPLKQHHIRSANRMKERTVSSIPKSQKGKTLYISILGRNPLNKSIHDT